MSKEILNFFPRNHELKPSRQGIQKKQFARPSQVRFHHAKLFRFEHVGKARVKLSLPNEALQRELSFTD